MVLTPIDSRANVGLQIGDPVASGTAGSVLFVDASGNLGQDNANFFWDDANNRLGLGTASPNEQLEITGNFRLATTTATVGQIKSGTNLLLHTYGTNNFFAGISAGNLTLTGNQNVGVGTTALDSLTSGSSCTAIGVNALTANTTGGSNTALGMFSLITNATGSFNTAGGANSLRLSTGANGTAFGFDALRNATGDGNTGVGYQAGDLITTGSYNTLVGAGADVGTNSLTNASAFGKNAIVNASNSIVLGGTGADLVNVGIGDTTPDARLDIMTNSTTAIGLIIEGAASQTASILEARTSAGVPYVTIGPDTLTTSNNFLNITGALPNIAGTVIGIDYAISASGATGNNRMALRTILSAGYTGSGTTDALNFGNNSAGTAAGQHFSGTYTGNHGIQGYVNSTTVGTNVGMFAYARKGNLNIGMFGTADDTKSGATNIGIGSYVVDPTGGGIYCAAAFRLGFATTTFESSVLLLDNGTEAQPILLARDNGTKVWQIKDGGTVNHLAIAAPGSPAEGDDWNDSTQKARIVYQSGIKQALVGCTFSQTASVTVTNTVTETTLTGSGVGTLTLPANFFVAGKTIRILASGFFSTDGAAPGTITVRVKLGSTVILATSAYSVIAGISSDSWKADGMITCRTTGAAGTVFGQGLYYNATDASGDFGDWVNMVNTATTTVDTTASQAITLTVQWGTADADNTITCTNLTVEVLN